MANDINTWTGSASTEWTNGGNWSLGHAPTTFETARFISDATVNNTGFQQLASIDVVAGVHVETTGSGILNVGTASLNGKTFTFSVGSGGSFDGTNSLTLGQYVTSATGHVTLGDGATYQWGGSGNTTQTITVDGFNATIQVVDPATTFNAKISGFSSGEFISWSKAGTATAAIDYNADTVTLTKGGNSIVFHFTDDFTTGQLSVDSFGNITTTRSASTPPPANAAPTADAVGASGTEDHAIAITLLGHDTDGTVQSFHLNSLPSGGSLYIASDVTNGAPNQGASALTTSSSIPASPGNLVFIPNADVNGTKTFTYTAIDDDGSHSASATATITIAPVNDAPMLTGDLAATVAEGGSYTLTTTDLNFNDPDDNAAGVTFTVANPSHGVVQVGGVTVMAFTGTQLANGDVHFVHDGSETTAASFGVTVDDGNEDVSSPTPATINFVVTPANDAPVITSNGGDAAALISLAENQNVVTTVTATDVDNPASDLHYAISGGADAALFAIDSVSGALSFLDAPNFENPRDAGHDNVYDVTVSVTDGFASDTQALAIRVTDVNETPPVSTDPSTGPDLLTGTSGSDAINAGAGNDTVNSGSGNDLTFGGDGADQITSTPAAGEKAQIYGGSGFLDPNDAGDTILVTGGGSAEIYGNGGDDAIVFRADGAGTIFAGVGNDRVTVVNNADNAVTGGPGADTITISGNGSNLVVGGTGITDPSDAGDTIRIVGNGNNTVYANGGDDVVTITGSGNNTVFGGVGNDTMSGGSGSDVLVGGPGDNVYTGGGGADRFVHTAGARDIVTDFSFAQGDHLDLGGQAYTLTSASDGAAALVFSDGGVVILQGITQAGFQAGFIA